MVPRLLSRTVPALPKSGVRASAQTPGVHEEWSGLMAAAQQGHGCAYRRLLAEITDWRSVGECTRS